MPRWKRRGIFFARWEYFVNLDASPAVNELAFLKVCLTR